MLADALLWCASSARLRATYYSDCAAVLARANWRLLDYRLRVLPDMLRLPPLRRGSALYNACGERTHNADHGQSVAGPGLAERGRRLWQQRRCSVRAASQARGRVVRPVEADALQAVDKLLALRVAALHL